MRILELFAGIGACSTALKRIGINTEIVDAVEIDKYAIASFNAIHDTNFEVQDITKYNKELKDIDLITHGSPCQDFSVAGKQAGGDLGSGTRSSLLYETIRIVGQVRPKYILWENVKNILSAKHKHNFDKYIETLDILGYNNYYKVLNAKDYGIPQNRERVYTISIRKDIDNKQFKFPEKEELKLKLRDMLEKNVDKKYYLKDEQIKNFIRNNNGNCNPSGKGINGQVHTNNISPTITTNKGEGIKINETNVIGRLVMDKWQDHMKRIYDIDKYAPAINTMQGGNLEPKILENPYIVASRGRNPNNPRKERKHLEQRLEVNKGGTTNCISTVQKDNYVVENCIKIRKLTPKECWRLMGFSDEDFRKAEKVNSNTQLYKQAGNSIVVNVLEKIFINLFN